MKLGPEIGLLYLLTAGDCGGIVNDCQFFTF